MNIQPSVIVWTVICFLLLTVILKNLLFTPVLKMLDSRKEKIEKAEQKLRQQPMQKKLFSRFRPEAKKRLKMPREKLFLILKNTETVFRANVTE